MGHGFRSSLKNYRKIDIQQMFNVARGWNFREIVFVWVVFQALSYGSSRFHNRHQNHEFPTYMHINKFVRSRSNMMQTCFRLPFNNLHQFLFESVPSNIRIRLETMIQHWMKTQYDLEHSEISYIGGMGLQPINIPMN